MGDFNLGGPPSCCGNEGYDDVLSILGNPRDFWLDEHPCGMPAVTHCGDPQHACDGPEGYCNHNQCAGAPSPELDFCQDGGTLGCFPADCVGAPAPIACAGWTGNTIDGCLNELESSFERIDFIFEMKDPFLSGSAFGIDVQDARVADWTVLDQPPPICPACPYSDCKVPPECLNCDGDCQCINCSCFECDPVLPPPVPIHVSDHLGVEATIAVQGLPSVWVDSAQTSQGIGTSCDPFVDVARGVAAAPAGNRVLIRAGFYPENLTLNRPVRLQAVGGTARIGF